MRPSPPPPAARDHSCPFSASSQPEFRILFSHSRLSAYCSAGIGHSRHRNALLHECGTGAGLGEINLPLCFKWFFNFSTKESKIFDRCLGVRNLCTVSQAPRPSALSVLWVSLHSRGCPTPPWLSDEPRRLLRTSAISAPAALLTGTRRGGTVLTGSPSPGSGLTQRRWVCFAQEQHPPQTCSPCRDRQGQEIPAEMCVTDIMLPSTSTSPSLTPDTSGEQLEISTRDGCSGGTCVWIHICLSLGIPVTVLSPMSFSSAGLSDSSHATEMGNISLRL